MRRHLWEYDHPFYGAESTPGVVTDLDSFAELREHVDQLQEGSNHVYRFDWVDWSQPWHDELFLEGEDRSQQELRVYLVIPRKNTIACLRCPITYEQEREVRAWLRGPRVLGALRTMWAPLLDPPSIASAIPPVAGGPFAITMLPAPQPVPLVAVCPRCGALR